MKTRSAGLATAYGQSSLTIARCWKVTRTDGQIFGFTTLDQDITVGGQLYKAATGFLPSAIAQNVDLSVANLEAAGFINSAGITEDDIVAGKWDGAAVEIYEVNYSNTAQGVMQLPGGTLGNVKAGRVHFVAELRGLAQALQQPVGTVYTPGCTANLGDARCGVALGPLTAAATVTSVTDRRTFAATSLTAADDYYGAGLVIWTSGLNNTLKMEVRTYLLAGGAVSLMLPMPYNIAIGDTFNIIAGCRKSKAVCFIKFNNVIRFRGFPDAPLNDKVVGAAGVAPSDQ